MGRRSEETIGSARLAEVGYALSLCECGMQRQTKLDYSNKGGSASRGRLCERKPGVVVYSQVGRGKAAEKPEPILR